MVGAVGGRGRAEGSGSEGTRISTVVLLLLSSRVTIRRGVLLVTGGIGACSCGCGGTNSHSV